VTIEEVTRKIGEIGVVPVVRAKSPSIACLAAEAISSGGIPIVEITMTVPDAIDVIRRVVKEFGKDLLTGAGTVITADQARACLDAGAQFLVSPGLSPSVLEVAALRNVLAIPGVLTPTEVMLAQEANANLLKVFPSGNLGGPRYVKALKGPFPNARMIPTGGVTLANASDFICAGSFALGVGSELVNETALSQGRSAEVTECARQFLQAVRQARTI
jgi:2-dehydro-3-deoxyphosphogluconate aldolase / (4S)-4-hydroxy-2-oxoglutarate aldolase